MIQVNEYFDGRVKSLALENKGGKFTVGVIVPGEYEFGTGTVEIMTVVCGSMDARLPGESVWKTYIQGQSFRVEKGVKFSVRMAEPVSYLCQYI